MNDQQRTCCFYDPLERVGCKAMDSRVCESRECTMHLTAQELKANQLASLRRRSAILARTAKRLGFVITSKAVWNANG